MTEVRDIKCATVESPFSSPTPMGRINNIKYAMLACEFLSKKGIAPYASHLINTMHVNRYTTHADPFVGDACDDKYHIVGRDKAIELTNEIRNRLDAGYFFIDFGESSGMKIARELLEKLGKPIIEVRLLDLPVWKERLQRENVIPFQNFQTENK